MYFKRAMERVFYIVVSCANPLPHSTVDTIHTFLIRGKVFIHQIYIQSSAEGFPHDHRILRKPLLLDYEDAREKKWGWQGGQTKVMRLSRKICLTSPNSAEFLWHRRSSAAPGWIVPDLKIKVDQGPPGTRLDRLC